MDGTPRRGFLDPRVTSLEDLWDHVEEVELENGMLGLWVFTDDWNTQILATIHTDIPYGTHLDDQTFLNLLEDFVEHVKNLPLARIEDREGAESCEEENQWLLDTIENTENPILLSFLLMPLFGAAVSEPDNNLDDGDIPF